MLLPPCAGGVESTLINPCESPFRTLDVNSIPGDISVARAAMSSPLECDICYLRDLWDCSTMMLIAITFSLIMNVCV